MSAKYVVPKGSTLRFKNGETSDVANPQRGDIKYDFSADRVESYNGSAWAAVGAGIAGGTLDQAYDAGTPTITVDDNAVLLNASHATNHAFAISKSAGSGNLIQLDGSGTLSGDDIQIDHDTGNGAGIDLNKSAGSGHALDVAITGGTGVALNVTNDQNIGTVVINKSGAGAGAVIALTNSGTGNDITGHGGNWLVTPAGNATFNNLTLNGSWTNPAFNGDEIHTCTTAAGVGFSFIADSITTGTGLRIRYDESTLTGGFAFAVYGNDSAANDFTIGENGATVITGDAAGTDALTLTAGDLRLTSGHAILTAGNFTQSDGTVSLTDASGTTNQVLIDHAAGAMADNNATLYIDDGGNTANGGCMIRLVPTGTPVEGSMGLEFVGATKVMQALNLDSDAVNNSVALINGGGALADNKAVLELTADGARTAGSSVLRVAPTGTPAAATSYGVEFDLSGQTHTNNPVQVRITGGDTTAASLQVAGTGAIAANAGMAHFTHGTGAIVADGAIVRIDGNAAAGGATAYGLKIDCNAADLEAIHVDAGMCLFDESCVFDGGIVLNDNDLIGFGTASADGTLGSDGTNIDWTVTAALTIGDGGTTNYANFASTGALTLLGTARRSKVVYLGPGDFSAGAGSPAMTQVGAGHAYGWALDKDADESIVAIFRVPDNWTAASDVTANIYWAANAVAGDAIFDVVTVPLAESEAVAGGGNTDSVTDTTDGTANDLNITGNITIGASTEWAAGDMVVLKINRDADNVNDTLAVDAIVLGIALTYTADRI